MYEHVAKTMPPFLGWTSPAVADQYGSGMSPSTLLRELERATYAADLGCMAITEAPRPHRR